MVLLVFVSVLLVVCVCWLHVPFFVVRGVLRDMTVKCLSLRSALYVILLLV